MPWTSETNFPSSKDLTDRGEQRKDGGLTASRLRYSSLSPLQSPTAPVLKRESSQVAAITIYLDLTALHAVEPLTMSTRYMLVAAKLFRGWRDPVRNCLNRGSHHTQTRHVASRTGCSIDPGSRTQHTTRMRHFHCGKPAKYWVSRRLVVAQSGR